MNNKNVEKERVALSDDREVAALSVVGWAKAGLRWRLREGEGVCPKNAEWA